MITKQETANDIKTAIRMFEAGNLTKEGFLHRLRIYVKDLEVKN